MRTELSEKEVFLLHYLRNRIVKQGIDDPVRKLFNNYKDTIQNLYKNEYLVSDNHSYFLNRMNVSELKSILKTLKLPITGKKDELINRITKNTSVQYRGKICPDIYYTLTEKSINIDNEYVTNRKIKQTTLNNEVLLLIKNGQFKESVYHACETYSKEVIPPGLGVDWNDKESIWSSQQKILARIESYDFSDLENSKSFKQVLIKCIFYNSFIANQTENSITLFLSETDEIMCCKDLTIVFNKYNYVPSEHEKWLVYIKTKMYVSFQVWQKNFFGEEKSKPLEPGEFLLTDSTIKMWKDLKEYRTLTDKNIPSFPKTFNTFMKYKDLNDEKYHFWISYT